MSRYRLTPSAQEDLVSIRDYYLEEAGARVARQILVELVETFRFLSRTPGAGHKRDDLAGDRPVLFWPLRDFLVIYQREQSPLRIVAVIRGTRDIPKLIVEREV